MVDPEDATATGTPLSRGCWNIAKESVIFATVKYQVQKGKNEKKRKPDAISLSVKEIKEFCAQEFGNLAYFNFEGNKALKSIFDHDLNYSAS